MSPAVPVKCVHPYSGLLVILSCENVFHDAQLSRDLKYIRQISDPTTKIKLHEIDMSPCVTVRVAIINSLLYDGARHNR